MSNPTPTAPYLSTYTDGNGQPAWMIIKSGLPVCTTKKTRKEAEDAARSLNIALDALVWDGDAGTFN